MTRARRLLMWAVTIAYAALLATVSLLPSGSGRAGGWDSGISSLVQNAMHVPAYTILAILTAMSIGSTRQAKPTVFVLIGLACILIGLLLEVAQAWIPGRTGGSSDVLWNAVGVAVGLTAVYVWRRHRSKSLASSSPSRGELAEEP